MVKQCQNCKNQFKIEPDDFTFYEKINVPPPTWCPDCRTQRRMTFRNERSFHRRKCDSCKKDIISLFSRESPYTVYCTSCWYSDNWDGLEYGKDFDSTKPFLQQFHELNLKVPQRAIINTKSINSEYTNFSPENKNCYMCVSTLQSENCVHGSRIFYSRDCLDCLEIQKCELCYECVHCEGCARAKYCKYSQSLVDCTFCYDCKGLMNCFGCVGLRNKSYYYLNQQLTKEAYVTKVKSLENKNEWEKAKAEYQNLLKIYPHKYARITNAINCSGDNILDSKNCHHCFFIRRNENTKYIFTGNDLKEGYDITSDDESQLIYELMSAWREYRVAFCTICWSCQETQYSNLCFDSSHLFGCVALRNKQYYILNTQYDKESFEKLRKKIVEDMNSVPYIDRQGRAYRYGEFFPPELSPFVYNETTAQEYFPLSREEALSQGYAWRDPEAKNYQITISNDQLPDHIKGVPDSITQEIIGCVHTKFRSSQDQKLVPLCNEQCTTAFKIIPHELQFYKRMDIPLPRLCPNCRHYQRLKQRNPLKLWHRKCTCGGKTSSTNLWKSDFHRLVYTNTATHFHGEMPCPNEFEASYAPERPEIVYCEQCYNAEVV